MTELETQLTRENQALKIALAKAAAALNAVGLHSKLLPDHVLREVGMAHEHANVTLDNKEKGT